MEKTPKSKKNNQGQLMNPGELIPGFYVDDENVASQASDVRPVASQRSDASSGLQVSQKTDVKPGSRMSHSSPGPRIIQHDVSTRMSQYGDASPDSRISHANYSPGPSMFHHDGSPRPLTSQHGHISPGPRMSCGDFSPVGPRMSCGDYSPDTRRSQKIMQTRYFHKTPSSPNIYQSDIPGLQTSQSSDASSDISTSQLGGLEEKPSENLANSPSPKDKVVRNLSGEFCELQNVGQGGGAKDIKDRTDNNDSGMNNSAPKMHPSIHQQESNMKKVVDCRPPSQHLSCVPQYPASSSPVLHNVSPSQHLSSSPHYPTSSFPVVMDVPLIPYPSPVPPISHNESPYQDIPSASYSSPFPDYLTQNPYDAVSLSDSESLLQEDDTSFMSLSSFAFGAREDNSNPGCTEHPQPSADKVACPRNQFPAPDHTDVKSFTTLPASTIFSGASGEKKILAPRKEIAPNELESLKLNYERMMCDNRVLFTNVPRNIPLILFKIHAEKMGTVIRVVRMEDGMVVMYLRPQDATKAFSHQHELLGVRLQVHRPKRRSCKLFVTKLPYYLTDLDIVKAFYKYGVVLDLKYPKQNFNAMSYCFVNIDEEGAEKILEHEQIQIKDVMCVVDLAKNSEIQLPSPNRQTNKYYNNRTPDRLPYNRTPDIQPHKRPSIGCPVTAFLSNLPSWATVEHLKNVFNAFDSDCYVKINKNFKGRGYVTFTSKEAQQRALNKSHSMQGHDIYLNYDIPPECHVYLGKLTPDMTWVLERELRHIGNVIKVIWPHGPQPDFCFAIFQDADNAANVIKAGKVYIGGRVVPARSVSSREKTT